MANIVGIDLGTSTTVVARFNDGGIAETTPNIEGEMLTPSIVQIEADGVITIGEEAKKFVGVGTPNIFTDFKRDLGSSQSWQFNGRSITPEDLSGYLLKQVINDYTGQFGPPDTTVISWPANFTNQQKQATQEAARRAGLKVIDYINEPTAAALYYAFNQKLDGTFLVYDMGGGTFDVTAVKVQGHDVSVIFSEGVDRLGGVDMDNVMLTIIARKFTTQSGADFDRVDCNISLPLLESCKHSLSTRTETSFPLYSELHGPFKITVSRAEFESAILPIIRQAAVACEKMLSDNYIDKASLREVFMVGGPARIPALQASVVALFGRKPIIREPDHAVARGTAIYAAIKTDSAKLTRLQRMAIGSAKVIDITPHFFGIALHEPHSETEIFNRVLIEKGYPAPHTIVKRLHTSEYESRTGIQLIITQGHKNERDINKVTVLHNGRVPISPNSPVGSVIEVTFAYDQNGVMHCELHEILTGKKTKLVLNVK